MLRGDSARDRRSSSHPWWWVSVDGAEREGEPHSMGPAGRMFRGTGEHGRRDVSEAGAGQAESPRNGSRNEGVRAQGRRSGQEGNPEAEAG